MSRQQRVRVTTVRRYVFLLTGSPKNENDIQAWYIYICLTIYNEFEWIYYLTAVGRHVASNVNHSRKPWLPGKFCKCSTLLLPLFVEATYEIEVDPSIIFMVWPQVPSFWHYNGSKNIDFWVLRKQYGFEGFWFAKVLHELHNLYKEIYFRGAFTERPGKNTTIFYTGILL